MIWGYPNFLKPRYLPPRVKSMIDLEMRCQIHPATTAGPLPSPMPPWAIPGLLAVAGRRWLDVLQIDRQS